MFWIATPAIWYTPQLRSSCEIYPDIEFGGSGRSLQELIRGHVWAQEELAETVAEALVSSHEQLSHALVDENEQVIN